jgi:transposase-like protein
MPDDTPSTLIEAVRYFADRAVCEQYMREIRWPDGDVACPHCSATGDRIGEIKSRHKYQCKACRKQWSNKVGTIFEDSPLPLGHWFVAVWAVANCKNGISSHELSRALGVQQRTAWFMLHRIRHAMAVDSDDRFDGPAEADTTYVVGKRLTYRVLTAQDDAGFMGLT